MWSALVDSFLPSDLEALPPGEVADFSGISGGGGTAGGYGAAAGGGGAGYGAAAAAGGGGSGIPGGADDYIAGSNQWQQHSQQQWEGQQQQHGEWQQQQQHGEWQQQQHWEQQHQQQPPVMHFTDGASPYPSSYPPGSFPPHAGAAAASGGCGPPYLPVVGHGAHPAAAGPGVSAYEWHMQNVATAYSFDNGYPGSYEQHYGVPQQQWQIKQQQQSQGHGQGQWGQQEQQQQQWAQPPQQHVLPQQQQQQRQQQPQHPQQCQQRRSTRLKWRPIGEFPLETALYALIDELERVEGIQVEDHWGVQRPTCPICTGGDENEDCFAVTLKHEEAVSALWCCHRATCGFQGALFLRGMRGDRWVTSSSNKGKERDVQVGASRAGGEQLVNSSSSGKWGGGGGFVLPGVAGGSSRNSSSSITSNVSSSRGDGNGVGHGGARGAVAAAATATAVEPQDASKSWYQPLSPELVAWFAERRISKESLERNKVRMEWRYCHAKGDNEWAIAFPFYKGGKVVNVKYRHLPKHFSQQKGGEQTVYGWDDIKEVRSRV